MAKIVGRLHIKSVASDALMYSAVTSSEIIAASASAAAYTSKEVVGKAVRSSSDAVGYTLDTVNRYTKDILDVGSFGNAELTDDVGSIAAGTAAMAAVNSVRLAKVPLKSAQIGLANVVYNDNRLNKASEKSAAIAASDPVACSSTYWNIAMRRERNPASKGINPLTRYRKLDVNSPYSSLKNKFQINRLDRLLKRKEFLLNTAKKYKTFNLSRSTKDMISNQSRKIVSLTLQGNDSNSLANRVVLETWNSARRTLKARKAVGRSIKAGSGIIKTTGKMLRHPIRTLKSTVSLVVSAITTITSIIIAFISGAFSIVIALLPVIIAICIIITVIVVLVSIVSFIASIFTVQASTGAGVWQEIPVCDTSNAIKDWARASQTWNPSSDQANIWNCNQEHGYACGAGTPPPTGSTVYGDLKKDTDYGFYYYEFDGEKYYTNAVASYYSNHIGDRFRVTTDTGAVFYIIVADQKADRDTKAGNACDSQHCVSQDGSMLEFYLDPSIWEKSGATSMNTDFGEGRNFSGAVTKMEKWIPQGMPGGQMGAPDFSNTAAWRSTVEGGLNPYNPSLYGQCTWGAWGKFYEIYGYGPSVTWDGSGWAKGIVETYPDKFELSSSPLPGAVYSGIGKNHVGIILDVNGPNLTVFDANFDYYSNPWEVAITDWQINKRTLSELISSYNGVIFANPKSGGE